MSVQKRSEFFVFYDQYISICENHGVSPSKALAQIGISKGSLGRWKNGGEPLNEAKKKIADYFGITIKQLMSGDTEPKEKSAAPEGNGLSEDQQICLDIFKRLNAEDQDLVIAHAEMLLKRSKKQ